MSKTYSYTLAPQYVGVVGFQGLAIIHQILFYDGYGNPRGGFNLLQAMDGSAVYTDQLTIAEPVPDDMMSISLTNLTASAATIQTHIQDWDSQGLFDSLYPV